VCWSPGNNSLGPPLYPNFLVYCHICEKPWFFTVVLQSFRNLIGRKRHTGGGLPLPKLRVPWKISNFEKFRWTKPTFRLYWRVFGSRDLPNRDGLQGKPSQISFRSNLLPLFTNPNVCIFSLASHFRSWFPRAFQRHRIVFGTSFSFIIIIIIFPFWWLSYNKHSLSLLRKIDSVRPPTERGLQFSASRQYQHTCCCSCGQ